MTMAVKIYTTRTCGYCQAALRLLRAKNIPYEQVDVTGNDDMRQWLVTATGQTTVPQIFIGDQAIGGYTDLAALDQSGKLQQMLQPSQ
jgi:glutaredoxin 3